MTITVNSNAPTEILFDLELDGVSTLTLLECRFCILSDVSMFFSCTRVGEKQYSVTLPILTMLEKNKTYKYAIEVIADNYYFKALEDSFTVKEIVTKATATVTSPVPSAPPSPKEPEPTSATTQEPEKKVTEPIPMVFKPGKRSFEMEPVSVDQPLIKSVLSDKKDEQPSSEPVKPQLPKKIEKKEPEKKDTEKKEHTETDKKVLDVIDQHKKEERKKVQESVSKEVLGFLEKHEKSKKIEQLLQEHTKSKKHEST